MLYCYSVILLNLTLGARPSMGAVLCHGIVCTIGKVQLLSFSYSFFVFSSNLWYNDLICRTYYQVGTKNERNNQHQSSPSTALCTAIIAAVSARSVSGVNAHNSHPNSEARETSFSVHPPSGPMKHAMRFDGGIDATFEQ